MPYLNVRLCAAPSQEVSTKVAGTLTVLTVEVLNKKRELTAVALEYIEPSDWFVGGISLATQRQGSFYLEIKVTEGTNTKDEKALYVSRVFSAMENILGGLNSASYVVIQEVHADAWGYEGQTQEHRYIRGKAL